MKTLFSRTVILLSFAIFLNSCNRDDNEIRNEDVLVESNSSYFAKENNEAIILNYSTLPLGDESIISISNHLHNNYTNTEE